MRLGSFERTAEGIEARFALEEATDDWTPRLRGGGAFVVKGLRLRVQP